MSCLNIINHCHVKCVSSVSRIHILNLLKNFIIMLQVFIQNGEETFNKRKKQKLFHSFRSDALHECYKLVFCIAKINLWRYFRILQEIFVHLFIQFGTVTCDLKYHRIQITHELYFFKNWNYNMVNILVIYTGHREYI